MRIDGMYACGLAMATDYNIVSLTSVRALCFVCAPTRRLHHSIGEFVPLFLFRFRMTRLLSILT